MFECALKSSLGYKYSKYSFEYKFNHSFIHSPSKIMTRYSTLRNIQSCRTGHLMVAHTHTHTRTRTHLVAHTLPTFALHTLRRCLCEQSAKCAPRLIERVFKVQPHFGVRSREIKVRVLARAPIPISLDVFTSALQLLATKTTRQFCGSSDKRVNRCVFCNYSQSVCVCVSVCLYVYLCVYLCVCACVYLPVCGQLLIKVQQQQVS